DPRLVARLPLAGARSCDPGRASDRALLVLGGAGGGHAPGLLPPRTAGAVATGAAGARLPLLRPHHRLHGDLVPGLAQAGLLYRLSTDARDQDQLSVQHVAVALLWHPADLDLARDLL